MHLNRSHCGWIVEDILPHPDKDLLIFRKDKVITKVQVRLKTKIERRMAVYLGGQYLDIYFCREKRSQIRGQTNAN